MDPRETSTAEVTDATEALRSALKSQYRAALAMLKEAIERCPQDAWADARYVNACWQVAYHTMCETRTVDGNPETLQHDVPRCGRRCL